MSALLPSLAPRVLDLAAHGERTAVVADGAALTYRELARRVADLTDRLGPTRRLVLVRAGNDLDSLVAHLAVVTGGHVGLLVPEDSPADALVDRYDPDAVLHGDDLSERRAGSVHDLHPDLALLMSTSGSTGSPKLVRLSHDNLAANANQIAAYLELTDSDRAITSLPLHYCYGLSVVHSHLLVGATLVLTDLSVVDECFWDLAAAHRVTSFAGVPHTFELLERGGFVERRLPSLPSLRYVTQAGGAMSPERVRRWARTGREQGWDLVVMYGQTEATARMAWLPPHLTEDHPDAAGVAIPGGSFRLDPVDGCPDGVGELVYSGPNVMLGYAESPADLALGRTVDELRTGDLARIDEGLVHVVGRRNRVAKLFGLRLDLDHLHRRLDQAGAPAHLVVADGVLWAFARHPRVARRAGSLLREWAGLPAGAVRGEALAELPRTASGKPDHAALAAYAGTLGASGTTTTRGEGVADAYARVLGLTEVDGRRSFVELGGDSLSYVELATRLEEVLPAGLPPSWHTMPVDDVAAATGPGGRRLDTSILVRAAAIVLVVATHADVIAWMGGAHVLLAVAGFNLARFQLALPSVADRTRAIGRSVATVAVPAALWIGGVALVIGDYRPSTALLVNGVLHRDGWAADWQFWFIEAFVWLCLGALALVSVPRLARLEHRHPWGFAAGVLAGAVALRFLTVGGVETDALERYTTWVVACFFAAGWAAARATTTTRRVAVTAAALAMTVGFFGDLHREAVVVGGVLLLTWVPAVPLPVLARPVQRVAGVLAASSLYVYLTHWQVYRPLEDAGHPWLGIAASFAVGVLAWAACRRVGPALSRRLGSAGSRRG